MYWRERGAPIAELIAAGLSAAAIDDATAPLGLRLPVEARIWFSWHDGVPHWGASSQLTSAGWMPLPMVDALGQYHQNRRLSVELYEPSIEASPDAAWPPSWFPLAMVPGGDTLAVDCDVPEGHPTPVRAVTWEDVDYARPKADSLTQAVEMWLRAIDEGLHGYSAEEGWYDRWPDITVEERRAWREAGLVV